MTVGHAVDKSAVSTATDPFVPWERPADWLAFTDPTIGQEKIVMLCAVQPSDMNYLAFTISGAYSIDWGDGTSVVNVAAGTKTSKQLLWSSYSGGTLTTRGYRQAVVTITPQSGQTFTSVDFFVAHTSPPAAGYSTTILDMVIAGPNVATLVISGNGTTQTHKMMERFRYVGTNTVSSMAYVFNGLVSLRTCAATNGQGYDIWAGSCSVLNNAFNVCFSLETGPVFYTTGALSSTNAMFGSCGAMRSVSLFNTSNVTSTSSMFYNCFSLTSVPAFDWSSLSTATSMFSSCYALTSIPAANTPVLTTANNLFFGCVALQALPAWDYSKVTTFASAANACSSLTDISALSSSTALGLSSLNTDMSNAFNTCRALKNLPPINTSGVVTMASCFYSATSIQTLPTPSGNNWKTSSCTNFNTMFSGCTALQTIPLIDTSAATQMIQMFNNCSALASLPALNVAACTSFTQVVNACTSLQSAPLVGARFAISFASCLLNATELNAMYTGLGTASGTQVVTVTGNPGTTGDTPSIATGKGWTVTGS